MHTERRSLVLIVRPRTTSTKDLRVFGLYVSRVGTMDNNPRSVSITQDPNTRRRVLLNALDQVIMTYGTLLVIHREGRAPVHSRYCHSAVCRDITQSGVDSLADKDATVQNTPTCSCSYRSVRLLRSITSGAPNICKWRR